MTDEKKALEGFQLVAEICGVPSDVCANLQTVWPTSKFAVASALKTAGYAGDLTAMMKQIEEYRETPAPVATPVAALAPAPTTGLPPQIIVKTGRPEDMPLSELLVSLASGERTLDYQNAIRRYVGNKRAFVRVAGSNTLDVAQSLELINFLDAGDDAPEFWGDDQLPTETLNEILDQTFYANPVTGKRLPRGNEWLKVTDERRVLAAYARLANKVGAEIDEFTLIAELQQDKLPPRWAPIEKAFKRDEKTNPELPLRARAALIWTSKGGSKSPETPASFRRGTSRED